MCECECLETEERKMPSMRCDDHGRTNEGKHTNISHRIVAHTGVQHICSNRAKYKKVCFLFALVESARSINNENECERETGKKKKAITAE